MAFRLKIPLPRRRKKKKTTKTAEKIKDRVADVLPGSGDETNQPEAPRITNKSVAEHREEVLSGGRRFLYPLQHSRHRVVIISALLVIFLVIVFFGSSWALLYKGKSTSDLAYRITQIVPFPVSKVNGDYVPYERYLFEIRSTIHYFRTHTQEGVDIDSAEGQQLLEESKRQALEKIKIDALAEQLAEANDIEVTKEQVDAQIAFIRNQGGIGESETVLSDVLSEFYGWDIDDLRRVVRLQLIKQKLPRFIDQETVAEAEKALAELDDGANFGKLAKKYSDDDLTRDKGGVIGNIEQTNTDLPPEFIEAAFNLEAGETTGLVESAFGLHIIKHQGEADGKRKVAHILFRYFNINNYLKSQLETAEVTDYITI